MNEDNNKLEDLLDEEPNDINDFGKVRPLNPIAIAIIIVLIIIGGIAAFLDYSYMTDKIDSSKQDTIDEMYVIESECLENADQISKEMTDELNSIKDYLTGIEEAISDNESLLSEYSKDNGYSELSVTYKNSTEKINNEFNEISGQIKNTKESIEKLIRDLEKTDNSNTQIIRELADKLDDDSDSESIEKLINELKKLEKNDTDSLESLIKELSSKENTNSETLEKLIREIKNTDSDNTDTIKELISQIKTENESSDKEIKELINSLDSSRIEDLKTLRELISQLETNNSADSETVKELIESLEEKESLRQAELKEEFEKIKGSISLIDEKFSSSHAQIIALINELKDKSSEDNKKLLEMLTKMDGELTGIEDDSLSQINDKLSGMEDKYSELLVSLENLFSTDLNKISSNINSKYDELNENVTNGYDQINENVNNRFDSLSVSFTSGSEDVKKDLKEIKETLQLVFQSVSDGKKLIASAITDKLVDSSKDASFANLACNIALIGTDVLNVEPSRILSGTRVYDGLTDSYVDGTMPDRGYQEDFNPDGIAQKTYESGYYPNSWTVDTTNAYNKGYTDAKADVPNAHVSFTYHEHKLSDGTVKDADYTCDHADGCFCEPVYNIHHHTGSPDYGGGCYSVRHEEEEDVYCGGHPTTDWGVGYGEYYYCDRCGAQMGSSGTCDRVVGHTTHVYYTLGCGKSEGVGSESDGVAYYRLGCGKSDFATAGEDATISSATIVYED